MATPGAAAAGGSRAALEDPGPPPQPPPGGPQPAGNPQGPGEPLPTAPAPLPAPQPCAAPEPKFLPPQAQPAPPAAPPGPGLEDYSFLPLVRDIIKCMNKDSQEVHQLLNELRTKFVETHKLIKSMQGIGLSPEQQQQQLQNLREQVKTKNKLLQKYKTLCMFEIPKE
ncbi:mediator of RNA polymerase II transcription subunit 9 [Ahaetulla prasina]|uniref:mediator of RNA polymerase II transcription subunit 9 n=1 Tax=Ahaetulla prasina TaxID=499056 RepID=UPI0026489EFC|nr:mediator of RNA polymerase II transcription subunit 9 [Ahaetulla prasina]